MKTTRNEAIFLLAVCLFALVGLTCDWCETKTPECPSPDPSPNEGCDEFKVLAGLVLLNETAWPSPRWYGFGSGDELKVTEDGQAQVNVSDCWPGKIFVFNDSELRFRVEDCARGQFDSSGYCNPMGTWYVDDCADEFVIWTHSSKITKSSSTYSVTYLPDKGRTTLVVVLDGLVTVEPVISLDAVDLVTRTVVEAGWFYFTMPDDSYSLIAGKPPREPYPLSELGPVAYELAVEDWMLDVHDRAEDDDRLHQDWPPELTRPGERPVETVWAEVEVAPETPPEPPSESPPAGAFAILVAGGPLNNLLVQEGIIHAVDWLAARQPVPMEIMGISTYLDGQWLDVLEDLPYNPDQAMELFDEAAYGREEIVIILYPEIDPPLDEAAEIVIEFLADVDVQAEPELVPPDEFEEIRQTLVKEEQPVIAIWH